VGPIIDSAESWLFVPAPPDLKEPSHSFDSYAVPLYSPEMMATAILAAPGMRIDRRAPSWEDWQARWEESGHFIEIGINAMEAESDDGTFLAGRVHPSVFTAGYQSSSRSGRLSDPSVVESGWMMKVVGSGRHGPSPTNSAPDVRSRGPGAPCRYGSILSKPPRVGDIPKPGGVSPRSTTNSSSPSRRQGATSQSLAA
jgi:hypothetical protein